MGPRSRDRGIEWSIFRDAILGLASMGPRSRDRGINHVFVEGKVAAVASMGPRSRDRGISRSVISCNAAAEQIRFDCRPFRDGNSAIRHIWLRLLSVIVDVVLCERRRGVKHHLAARGFNCQRTLAYLCDARRHESFKLRNREHRVWCRADPGQ